MLIVCSRNLFLLAISHDVMVLEPPREKHELSKALTVNRIYSSSISLVFYCSHRIFGS